MGICTVENRNFIVGNVVHVVQISYDSRHLDAFLFVAVGFYNFQRFSDFRFAVHFFGNLNRIVFDQTVGSIDDVLCRTVVALQFKQFCCGVLLLKAQYIVDACASEGIDALCVVSDNADSRSGGG